MEKIPNIQATKEYQFAKEVENMLNNYSFNHSVFAASIPFMHPTIQQLLYRLIRKCLKVMPDEELTGYSVPCRKKYLPYRMTYDPP